MKIELEEIYYLINSAKFDNYLMFGSIKHPTVDQERANKARLGVFDSIVKRLDKTYPEYSGFKYGIDNPLGANDSTVVKK
jgi:hypothetical protein